VGRRDDQVKIHGVRIELGEIEASVLEYPNILQASAVVLNSENNPQVCVYYTASDAVNSNDIRNHIAHRLPRQMLPALFMQIDSMPIASGGKVNKKALPIPDFSKSKPMTEYSAPQTELEKQVSNIIEQLLNISRVSIDDDLFDCGLNSLKVIEFIITLQKEGISLNAQDVYNHPSVRSLSTFVENHLPQINAEDSNRSNLRDVMEASLQTKNKAENVFLTGATGFLGIHVLKELYRTTDKTIYCLIRDPKKFESAIVYYTDIPYPNERIICFCGDITEASLGLKSNEYELLCNDIGDIIHCAATVSLFGAWETSKRINYSGTCNVIALAEKASAKLHHISTISVSGDMIVPQEKPHCEFSENDLYIGQSYTENVYVHSKYLAEEAVISAIKNAKINASIYRIGHILWDSHTGLFQMNYQSNDVYMLMDAFRTIGKLPAEFATHKMPIIPVNECARIICHELRSNDNRVYHLYDNSITWGEMMAMLGISESIPLSNFINKAQNYQLQTVRFAEMLLFAVAASKGRYEVNVTNVETQRTIEEHGCTWINVEPSYIKIAKKGFGGCSCK
jgi:fengycin family lipopeptide synthetase D